MAVYYGSLLSVFPEGNNFTPDVIAEVWVGIVNANQDYMRYVSYLNPVIETNVTVERLAVFKKKYYDLAYAFRDRLAQMLGTNQDAAYKIQLDVLFLCFIKCSLLLQKSSCPGSSQTDQHYSAANGFLQGHERLLKNAAGV